MSQADDLFRDKLIERANRLGGDLRENLIKGYTNLKSMVGEVEMVRLINSGAIDQVFSQSDIEAAFVRLTDGIEQGTKTAGTFYSRYHENGVFNVLSPTVLEGIEKLNTTTLNKLGEEIREGVRTRIEEGLKRGEHPRTMARDLRESIGLAPNQHDAVANYRGLLEAGDRDALKRELRDARYDKVIERGGMTAAQIDRAVAAYQKNFIAFNAETNARTIALDAQKAGHQLQWANAVERGFVDGRTLTKRWSGTDDDRRRPEHEEMEGETVPYDEPFSNGQMTPGEGEYNCRCTAIYEHGEPRAADATTTEEEPTPPAPEPELERYIPPEDTRGTPEFFASAEPDEITRYFSEKHGVDYKFIGQVKPAEWENFKSPAQLEREAARSMSAHREYAQQLDAMFKEGFRMPENIVVAHVPGEVYAAYVPLTDTIRINIDQRVTYNSLLNEAKTKFHVVADPKAVMTHEMGHLLHNDILVDTFRSNSNFMIEKMIHWSDMVHSGEFVLDDMFNLAKERLAIREMKLIAAEVSGYATSNPAEFVAETFTGLRHGKTYSAKVMQLYNILLGPEVHAP